MPPQHKSTLRNEQVQFLYHVLRYQRAMHSPATHEVSGISFHYLVSGPLPPAYCGSLLASTPSTSYSRGTTEPLCPTSLDQETRSRPRARSSRFARRASGPNRPPQPIMLLLFVSPLRHCLGSFTGRTISCKRAECLFACVSSTLHAQHSDQSSSPCNFRAQNAVKPKKNRCFT